MGYKTQAFKGVSWLGLLRGSTRVLTFLRLAVLARILTPTQFGVFGIASLMLSFLEIITETGINIFLIQEKKDIREYLNSAWAVSIIRGFLIAFILLASAPFIANFFNSEESIHVIYLIALVPMIRAFINPSIVYIHKNIQFQKEFYLRFTLFAVDSSVAVVAAFITRDAASFAYGLIVSAFLEVFFSFLFFKPRPRFTFEVEKVRHIIKRGWWVTLTGLFSYFADNGDNLAVGKIMGTGPLGLYQVAYRLSTLPITEITDVVNKVVFPVYSKFSEDRDRLMKAFTKVTLLSSVVALFLALFIFIFARDIILIIVGPNWLGAVPAIKVLSFYAVLRTVFGNFAPLFLSVGRQDYVAKMTFFRVAALVVTIVPLTSLYGLVGASFSAVISIVVEVPIILYFFNKAFRNA